VKNVRFKLYTYTYRVREKVILFLRGQRNKERRHSSSRLYTVCVYLFIIYSRYTFSCLRRFLGKTYHFVFNAVPNPLARLCRNLIARFLRYDTYSMAQRWHVASSSNRRLRKWKNEKQNRHNTRFPIDRVRLNRNRVLLSYAFQNCFHCPVHIRRIRIWFRSKNLKSPRGGGGTSTTSLLVNQIEIWSPTKREQRLKQFVPHTYRRQQTDTCFARNNNCCY